MSDTTRIRIAQQMAREIEFEVDDADAVVESIETAMASDGDLVWIVDSRGNRHGIAVNKLAFIEVESDDKPSGVGFSAGS